MQVKTSHHCKNTIVISSASFRNSFQHFFLMLLIWNCIIRESLAYDSNSLFTFDLMTQPRQTVDASTHRRYLRADYAEAPLYRGYGTHFVYVWAGTPPQRVSVIVDTGSHHTAFPCKGCPDCGKHTDNYWDPSKSSTAHVEKCNGGKCSLSQRYTEGSSWRAFKVKDIFWIGTESLSHMRAVPNWNVTFSFGCQSSETGLFRTQLENGIMGMSADPATLPYVMKAAKIIPSATFSLCFLHTGGAMSIGASPIAYEALNRGPMQWAALTKKTGYFTVSLEGVFLRKGGSDKLEDIGEPKSKFNTGKGIIVDSGTTDSYLPSSVAVSFKRVFKALTGLSYSNTAFSLTVEQLKNLPVLVYKLRTIDGGVMDVEFPPKNYMEAVANQHGKFIPRLYLQERSGGVIGANMMIGHNVVFDIDQQRVGFAKSDCQVTGSDMYDKVTKPFKIKRRLQEEEFSVSEVSDSEAVAVQDSMIGEERRALQPVLGSSNCPLVPLGPCSALCGRVMADPVQDSTLLGKTAAAADFLVASVVPAVVEVVEGRQLFGTAPTCPSPTGGVGLVQPQEQQHRICRIPCSTDKKRPVRGSTVYPQPVWSDCDVSCSQRRVGKFLHIIHNSSGQFSVYEEQTQERPCQSKMCAFNPLKDCVYIIRMTVPMFDMRLWSRAWKEELTEAVAKALQVSPGLIDMPSFPQQNRDKLIQLAFHLRLPVAAVGPEDSSHSAFPAQSSGATNPPSALCPVFPISKPPMKDKQSLVAEPDTHRLINDFCAHLHAIEYPISGNWTWITTSNIRANVLTPQIFNTATLETRISLSNANRNTARHAATSERPLSSQHVSAQRDKSSASRPPAMDFSSRRSLVSAGTVALILLVVLVLYAVNTSTQLRHRKELEVPRRQLDAPAAAIVAGSRRAR